MERKMFGHRLKKKATMARVPGEPYGEEDNSYGKSKDNPHNYEGKEHVKYKNPGFSPHNIDIPEDEPHMKSHVTRDEEHEAEDDYHMKTPDQTMKNLEAHIKRARMKMDAPDQEDPDYLRGNMVHDVGYEGDSDTSGEEEEGPNEMQSAMPKEQRKKMIVAVTKRKMKKSPSMY